jgi:hypothetical protein
MKAEGAKMSSDRFAVTIIAVLLLAIYFGPTPVFGQGGETNGLSGRVIYKSGSEQPFTSFRCEYYSRLGHSVDYEAIIADSDGTFSVVTLDKIERIDFPGRTNKGVRYGTMRLFDSRTLEGFFYVDKCEWTNGKAAKGTLDDTAISAMVFTAAVKH